MKLNEYQQLALRTDDDTISIASRLLNGLMGLNGEAGEAIDIMKKSLFQGHELDIDKLEKELGDVLWYLAISANALDCTLEHIAQRNIDKLKARYPEGFSSDKSINRTDE